MNKILRSKISLWAGAIFDGLVLFPILSPEIGGMIFGILPLPSFFSAIIGDTGEFDWEHGIPDPFANSRGTLSLSRMDGHCYFGLYCRDIISSSAGRSPNHTRSLVL